MSIGKVVSSYLGVREEHFYVHILDEKQAEDVMENQPPGYSLLRIEKPSDSHSPVKVLVTFKYQKMIVHRNINVNVKISSTSGSMVKCKTHREPYRYLCKINNEFLRTLRLFITEMINNANYLEDIEESNYNNELLYRKFIIYPEGDRVIVKRRLGGNEVAGASIGYDFVGMRFFAVMNNITTNITSFNQFLISEFLEIDITDKLLVRHALGYQRDVDLFTGKERDLNNFILSDNSGSNSGSESEYSGPILRTKEKDKVIERLKTLVGRAEAAIVPHWRAPPEEVRKLLATVLESVIGLRTQKDKMDWINRGILDIVFQAILRNGNTESSYNTVPIKIAKHLLTDNEEGCKIFGYNYIKVLDGEDYSSDSECVGIYQSIYVLTGIEAFRKLFLEGLGMSRLMKLYEKFSVLLLGEHSNPMGDIGTIYDPSTNSISSPRDFSDNSDSFDDDDAYNSGEEYQQTFEETVFLSPKGKSISIPKLNLTISDPIKIRAKSVTEKEFKCSATEELTGLAINLGETYMTQNLTALLSQLNQNDAKVKARKEKHKSHAPLHKSKTEVLIRKNLHQLRTSAYYQIKCWILRTLARVTEYWEFLSYLPSPVNFLFSEALIAHKDCLLYQDNEFRCLLYKTLSNYSLYIDYQQRNMWDESMTNERGLLYRKKMDKFIWRIYNRLCPAIEARDHTELETQLSLLMEYMKNCSTNLTAMQVSDVCMESLLKVKEIILSRGRITNENMDSLLLAHRWMQAIDEICEHSTHAPLDGFLVSLLIENRETWRFYKHYSCQILFSKQIERRIGLLPTHLNYTISSLREDVIYHLHCCFKLIKRHVDWLREIEKDKSKTNNKDYESKFLFLFLERFEFLLHPTEGSLLRLMEKVKGTTSSYGLQIQILKFLCSVFSVKKSVYIESKEYIDSYISYAYLNFLKLYHNTQEDDQTLELIHLLLQLLIEIARNKNNNVTMKFYQLRAMNFFVHQINLEYEITLEKVRDEPKIDLQEPKYVASLSLPGGGKKKKAKSVRVGKGRAHRVSLDIVFGEKRTTSTKFNTRNSLDDNKASRKHSMDIYTHNSRSPRDLSLDLPSSVKRSVSDRGHIPHEPIKVEGTDSDEEIDKIDKNLSINDDDDDKDNNNNDEEDEEITETSMSELDESTEESTEEDEESEYSEESSEEEEEKKQPKKGLIIPKLKNCPTRDNNSNSIPKLTGIPQKGITLSSSNVSLNSPKKSSKVKEKKHPLVPSLANYPVKGEKRGSAEFINSSNSTNNMDKPMGLLSQLECKVNTEDPKWQLLFEKQKADEPGRDTVNTDMEQVQFLYNQERHNRKIYNTQRIHISVIHLIISLMISPNGTLDKLYCDQFPLDNKKMNIPFLLREHLKHPANQTIIPSLIDETQKLGDSYFRLLKLLCTSLFRKDIYNDLHRLAIGAYGTVYRSRLKPDCQTMNVAIKLMEVPKTIHDRCVVHDIFDEIFVLDKFKDDNRISRAYDFGTDDDYYWITMKKYKCSLKHWRSKQTAPFHENLALYLNIYMNVLNAFQFLTENRVNHFDVKCDNFLIQPLNEENWTPEDEENFWNPVSDVPNFSVCLADFGESKVYSSEIEGYTTRNRGTEFTKSPEMLVVAYASQKTRSTYDRRKKVGASSPSDIWSLGCLLYELLTGEFLFYDQDWVRFFIRVTSPGQELITSEKKAKIDNNSVLIEFLMFILCRDPRMRPSIHDVIKRFKYVRSRLLKVSPVKYSPRIPTPRKRLSNPTLIGIENNDSSSSSDLSKDHHHNNNDKQQIIKKNLPSIQIEEPSPKLPSKSTNHQKTLPFPLIHSISQSKLPIPDKKTSNIPDYFLTTPSEIFEYLYVSPISIISSREILKQYGITHLINCTEIDNPHKIEFNTLNIPLSISNPALIITEMKTIVEYINDAKRKNGKVLVYCEDGTGKSAIVAIAYIMVLKNCSYFEAFIFARNKRYVIDPDECFIKQLCKYHHTKKRNNARQYQCICGACAFGVSSNSFYQTEFPNPFSCSCTFEDPSSRCPNIGCSEFLQKMKKYYNYPATEVVWGFTYLSQIDGDFDKTTQEYNPSKDLIKQYPKNFEPKNWTVYKCRSCDFVTHALRKSKGGKTPAGNFDAVIVTSIPVSNFTS